MATGCGVPGEDFQIASLIGKRALMTLDRIELVTPIEAGSMAVDDLYARTKETHPNRPCAKIYDGWIRGEYGRTMDRVEVYDSLVSSGLA